MSLDSIVAGLAGRSNGPAAPRAHDAPPGHVGPERAALLARGNEIAERLRNNLDPRDFELLVTIVKLFEKAGDPSRHGLTASEYDELKRRLSDFDADQADATRPDDPDIYLKIYVNNRPRN